MQIGVQNFVTRTPPRFETKEAERTHSLQRLAAACRIFGRRGFSEGLLGHVTVRDPELPDHFWVNPVGVAMHQVKVSHLVQVNPEGKVVRGSGMVNPVGLLLHTAVHRARPEVNAVCHAHALHASTWSSFERLLDPITQDACIFFENQALILEPRVVRDAEAAKRFAAGFGDRKVAIHGGHGIFTTGQSIDEAAWWFVLMNRCCEAQLLAEAAGKPTRWNEEDARWLASVLGSPTFGWLSFQTLWDEIIASDPDLVD
ncbi:Ribulose-5-phosphate 4-epimerase/Fuculose-1-phosphate aldolase [Variovorax sp. HW608]|uniref:class II aldolase/adducin family protein n=1 Tax=Variovorax sp. HW608 TaxID=1034889 RepID=UPI00081FA018|nr:class II aldolase/adducin family protein [Variovorax sp. HW608]SCK55210.1 Ribulose-5-phosphate 4-epimerase/Fuculose-1-phosphate aldolase [Variovorax sp. HW608]